MCSHTLVKTTEPKNLYSGSSAALRGHQDSGMSLAWAVFDSTSAFSIVTASTPQVPVAVEIFAGVAFLLQGPGWGCDGTAWLTAWPVGCDTLLVLGFEEIMPSSSSLNPVVKSDEWVVSEKT